MTSVPAPLRARLAAAALIALCGGCYSALEPIPTSTGLENFVGATGVPITRLGAYGSAFAYQSGYTAAERLVIRDEAAWSSAWATIWQGTTPKPALPVVDFTRDMVVLAALGQRSSGGYGILVDSAAATQGELLVRVRSTSPGPHCMTTAALTEPVDVVRVPRSSLPVRFAEYAVVTDCP